MGIAKHSDPENPVHTLDKLLYSLAHDMNRPEYDIPIKRATTTTNRKRIREDILSMIKSITKLIQQLMNTADNIINVRCGQLRTITKMIIRVWTKLLGAHPKPKRKLDHWSTRNCGECGICVREGPHPLCLFCNIELIGFVNLLKIVTTLPRHILESTIWEAL